MESETNSIKSAKKQVGFAAASRPRLYIPPPQEGRQFTATPGGVSRATTGSVYARKKSVFDFEQLNNLKDFTRSGLGVGEKCAYWLYNKLRAWSRKWFTHIFLTVVLVVYTVGGALIFELIEGQTESAVVAELIASRHKFLQHLRHSSLNGPREKTFDEWFGQTSREMQEYERKIANFYKAHKLTVSDTSEKKWTFLNAAVFCATVYTSMGYGHIYPETKTGKALTIVYATIGIPLFLIALTDFGKLFTRCIKFLWSFVRRLYYTGSCRNVRKTAHVEEIVKGAQIMYEIATFRRPSTIVDPENPDNPPTATETPTTPAISNFEIDDEFNLPISLAIFILVLYILLGGLIYCVWEGWAFFDSFYFVFISMSTVGFGDLVPNDANCMIVSIVYLVFGLALMSMCINVVQAKLSDTFQQASTKIGVTIGIAVAEDDGSIVTVPPGQVELPLVHDAKSVVSAGTDEPTEEEKKGQ